MAENIITTRRKVLKLSGAALCGPLAIPFVTAMPAVAGGIDPDAELFALIDEYYQLLNELDAALKATDSAGLAEPPPDLRRTLKAACRKFDAFLDTERWDRFDATPARTAKGVLAKLRLEYGGMDIIPRPVAAAMGDLERIAGGAA